MINEFIHIIFLINMMMLAMDHFITGSLALFFPEKLIKISKIFFGATIPATNEYRAILKPWGALGIFASIVGVIVMIDPQKYKLLLIAFIVLLINRIYYRVKFVREANAYFRISRKRNFIHIFLIVTSLVVVVTFLFCPPLA